MTTKVEQAKVEGIEVEDKSPLQKLEELVDIEASEERALYRVMDAALSREIVDAMRGHYTEELIYNYPRATSTGKKSWPLCDRMKGSCSYKGLTNHIHIIGIGYQGALTAMRAYGQIDADISERPTQVDEGDRMYWAAYAEATDRHSGNRIARWYLQPVLMKTKKGFIENEFGASVVQSKALRNVVLALLPRDLLNAWIEDYKAGRKPFDATRTKELGYNTPARGRKKQPPKEKSNPKPKPPSANALRDFEAIVFQAAEKTGLDAVVLGNYAEAMIASGEFTRAKMTLYYASGNPEEITEKVVAWKKEQEAKEPDAVEEALPGMEPATNGKEV